MATFTDNNGVPLAVGQPVVYASTLGRSPRAYSAVVVKFTPQRVGVQPFTDLRGRTYNDPEFTHLAKYSLIGSAVRRDKNHPDTWQITNIVVVHTMWPEAQALVDLHLGTPELDNALLGV